MKRDVSLVFTSVVLSAAVTLLLTHASARADEPGPLTATSIALVDSAGHVRVSIGTSPVQPAGVFLYDSSGNPSLRLYMLDAEDGTAKPVIRMIGMSGASLTASQQENHFGGPDGIGITVVDAFGKVVGHLP